MRHRALWLAPLLAIWLPVAAWAAKADTKSAAPGKLKALHERIENLNRELARNNESRASVSDQLRETESSISTVNRHLRQLGEQRNSVRAELDQLDQQSRRVSTQIEAQQQQLSRLLYRQNVQGESDALKLLLSGEDPNQIARDRYFLVLLSRAKAQLLNDLRDALEQKKKLVDSAHAKNDELTEIGRKQEVNRVALVTQQQQRQVVLARISDKINAQRREIGTLKANEARLSKLIEGLARSNKNPRKRDAKPSANPATPDLKNQQTPELSAFHGAFASLRGKLRLPVKGEISSRFGSTRAEGGATWKGLFIRAAEGSEVKAVAAGRVVFADWLRGFGNLLILDHGDGYMSIYGNNQSLFRETGEEVKAGDTVAAVGNSGGNPESGLYFELRQQGQAFDPLKWASLR